MSPTVALAYLGGAAGYGALLAGVLLLGWTTLRRRPPTWAECGLALSAAFALFLGLHPFPDPADVACQAPRLRPFAFWQDYTRLWHADASLRAWLTLLGAVAPAMNVVLFAPVGLCLGVLGIRPAAAALTGLALSLVIETAQLTGLWGIYPCAYRRSETDDLLLNTFGVWAGAVAMRRLALAR